MVDDGNCAIITLRIGNNFRSAAFVQPRLYLKMRKIMIVRQFFLAKITRQILGDTSIADFITGT